MASDEIRNRAAQPSGDATVSASWVRSLTHDLNNLLTQISGYADLLQLEAGCETVAEDVAEIQLAVRKAGDLTRELLVGATPEDG